MSCAKTFLCIRRIYVKVDNMLLRGFERAYRNVRSELGTSSIVLIEGNWAM